MESDETVVQGVVPFTIDVQYSLALPHSAPPPAGFPILLCLHGFGENGERMRERLAALQPCPFAVLAPDGPYPVEMRAKPPDQPARIGHAWYQFTGDQVAFGAALQTTGSHLERVLDHVAREHPVDRQRVVVLGYSQGGYLASVWALKHALRFRGLIAIACRIKTEMLSDDELAAARALPVLAIHGRRDEQVRFEPQEQCVAALKSRGLNARLFAHDGGHGMRRELVPVIRSFVDEVLCFPA